MPQSKSRHPHKHSHHHTHQTSKQVTMPEKPAKTNRAVLASIIFCTVLGFLVSLIIDATSVSTLAIGTIVGAAAGFFLGEQIKKSLPVK